jgi:hypothetical protein
MQPDEPLIIPQSPLVRFGSRIFTGERGLATFVFLASCLYLCLFYNYTVLNVDEGVSLQGAERILHGEVPYRDFFSFYTPGSYYLAVLLFRVFGNSIHVVRAALVIYGGLFSLFTYVMARRVCPRWNSLLAALLVTLTALPSRFAVLHNWDSTLVACAAIYSSVLLLERPRGMWAFVSGSLVALTFLIEQSKGGGLAIGLALGFALLRCWGQGAGLNSRLLLFLVGGMTWPFVVTLSYFLAHGSVGSMLAGWFWPLIHYSTANRLPYGFVELTGDTDALWNGSRLFRIVLLLSMSFFLLLPFLPLAAVAILVWFIVRRTKITLDPVRWNHVVLVSASATGLLLSIFLTKRCDFTHLNFLAPLFYLIMAWILDGLDLRSRLWVSVRSLVVLWIVCSASLVAMAMLWPALSARHTIATARGNLRAGDDLAALGYMRAHLAEGEKVLVYPYGPIYYYATGTFSSSYFDFLQPGMHPPQDFKRALDEIISKPPRVVIFQVTFRDSYAHIWPNTPLSVLAAKDPIEEFVFKNYRPCSILLANSFWHIAFMVRKDAACDVIPEDR